MISCHESLFLFVLFVISDPLLFNYSSKISILQGIDCEDASKKQMLTEFRFQINWCFFCRLQIFKQEQFCFPGHLPLAFSMQIDTTMVCLTPVPTRLPYQIKGGMENTRPFTGKKHHFYTFFLFIRSKFSELFRVYPGMAISHRRKAHLSILFLTRGSFKGLVECMSQGP